MSEMPAIAPATGLQWVQRAALNAGILLILLVLGTTWVALGRSNTALPPNAWLNVYRYALSLIALLLATTAFAIAWFARLDRANVLAAAFASALALGFAWILCDYTGSAAALLRGESGQRALSWIGALMAMVYMATPVLFLLFTEVFPAPLPASVRARAVLPQLWRGNAAAADDASGSGWGRPLLVALWLIACTTCAIGPVYGIAAPSLYIVKAMLVICVTIAVVFVTARAIRYVDRRTQPTVFERWVVPTGKGTGVSALTLLGFMAVALAVTLDLNIPAGKASDVVASTSVLFLLAFVVLLACIRPIRAESPTEFWIGWVLLAAAAIPQIVGVGDPLRTQGANTLIAWGFWTVVCLLAGCANLVVSHARGDDRARARIQWILAGGVLALVAIVALVVVSIDLGVRCDFKATDSCAGELVAMILLPLAPPTFMTLGMLLAIFASGALDSALALRRSAVFTIVLLIVGALFGVIEGQLEHLLQDVAPGTAKPIAIAASLIVFHPTKHLCEIGVKRALAWMFRMSELA